MTPFHVDGPATISFSGGRTSGLMLWRILSAHGGQLPSDVHVLFANTGKERAETLDFVHECERRWAVPIHWLEYRRPPTGADLRAEIVSLPAVAAAVAVEEARGRTPETRRARRLAVLKREARRVRERRSWEEVTCETASRQGEPFAALIEERRFLPNPVTRFCTQELKIRPMKRWALARGWTEWSNVVGLRADEPRRVAKMRAPKPERYLVDLPLVDAGITLADVTAFWRAQPFDLQLEPWEGNCDLCFLKGMAKRERIMRDRPDLAEWWIEKERSAWPSARGAERFRHDVPGYAQLLVRSQQPRLPLVDDLAGIDELEDCACTG